MTLTAETNGDTLADQTFVDHGVQHTRKKYAKIVMMREDQTKSRVEYKL